MAPGAGHVIELAFRRVRQVVGGYLDDGEVLVRMMWSFAESQLPAELELQMQKHEILERDKFRCQSPRCTSQGPLHGHHMRFRSLGGPDHAWNSLALCDQCHALLHDGRFRIFGRAPGSVIFLFGRLPDGRAREAWLDGRRIPAHAFRWDSGIEIAEVVSAQRHQRRRKTGRAA